MSEEKKANPLTVAKARLSQRHLLTALNETSAAARNGWLLFLGLMGYLIVALAGITHENLLLNSPVHLPILNIKVALDRFFLFAPLFLMFVHGGMVIQHIVLARKLHTFNELIKQEQRADQGLYHPLRYELHSYFFVQAFAGPPGSPLLNFFFRSMVATSLWILPVLLLVYFQTAFLPFHDPIITAAHRFYIMMDLMLLIGIGIFVNQPETLLTRALAKRVTRRPVHFVFGVIGVVATLFFSFLVATIPDSFLDRVTRDFPPFVGTPVQVVIGKQPDGNGDRHAFWPTAVLFENIKDTETKKSKLSFFQRNLVVTDKDLVPNREDNFGEVSESLRNRDLRYANLKRTDLHRVDMTGADLTGASLVGANLKNALLTCPAVSDEDEFDSEGGKEKCTKLIGTDLRKVDLAGADLRSADLRFASLESANLSAAQFEQATLYGANLSYAKMRRANFSLGMLQGADLSWSNAQGANFSVAQLQGTNFQNADLIGANFAHSKMQGADMSFTRMIGSVMRNTQLYKADFSSANLNLADLRKVKLFGAVPVDDGESVILADFRDVKLESPDKKQLEYLKKMLKTLPKKVRETVEEKLGDLPADKPLTWESKDLWQPILTNAEGRPNSKDSMNLTNRLGNLGCLDKSEEDALVNAVIERALYQFNGDTMLLYHRVLNKNCSPINKVPKTNIEQLQKAASEYEKKSRKARRAAVLPSNKF